MCGIVGGWMRRTAAEVIPQVENAIRLMRHRGPDDRGYECDDLGAESVVFGHARLSIIDLTAGGHQPMVSSDERYVITYNGEVYNYKELKELLRLEGHTFRTDSDTEVLLNAWALWGKDCLPRLKGMFAFAIYDRWLKTITCARDAFGIKPLFIAMGTETFAFASETNPLLAFLQWRPVIDWQRSYDYLVSGSYDDEARTFFRDVKHLLPGHVVTFDVKERRLTSDERWWWPGIAERTDVSFAEAADQVREMFLDNVRLHLRSDVPLGVALSGGIDSSALVCAARLIQPDLPMHTFTYVARTASIDEESWADIVNDRVGAIAHKVIVSGDEIASDMDDMIRCQGEPFASTSIYAGYRVLQRARELGITVVLDGQGADELFAGYHGYIGARLRSLCERGRFVEAARLVKSWHRWPGRDWSTLVLSVGEEFVAARFAGAALKIAGRSLQPEWIDVPGLRAAGVTLARTAGGGSLTKARKGRRLGAALRVALVARGLPALLRHGDRNAMRWSVEGRVPFLTTDLAEFALSLPEEYLLSSKGETKHVFRAAMRGIVPDEILNRRDKVGFATPELEWLRQLEPSVMQWLEAAGAASFVRVDAARREIRRVLDGRARFSFKVWRLLSWCRWLDLFGPRV